MDCLPRRFEFSFAPGFLRRCGGGPALLWPALGRITNGGLPMFAGQTTTIFVLDGDAHRIRRRRHQERHGAWRRRGRAPGDPRLDRVSCGSRPTGACLPIRGRRRGNPPARRFRFEWRRRRRLQLRRSAQIEGSPACPPIPCEHRSNRCRHDGRGHGYRSRDTRRSTVTKGHSRASPPRLRIGSLPCRTGSCATSSLAEDATQQALLTIWRDLPQLRDPARFDAWSYRLLVRACYAEGRKPAAGRRTSACCRPMSRWRRMASSSVVDRDQLERGFRRLSLDHRTVVVLHHYLDLPLDGIADVLGIPVGTAHLDFITRCAGCARRSTPTRARRHGRPRNEHRSRRHPHRSVVASRGRARVRRPRARPCSIELDTTPQRRPLWLARRFPPMNTTLRIALATLPSSSSPSSGSGSWGFQTTSATRPRRRRQRRKRCPLAVARWMRAVTSCPTRAGRLSRSRSRCPPGGRSAMMDSSASMRTSRDELALTSWDVTHVFAHACTRPDGDAADLVEVGPTVEDLASALAGQEERVTSGPSDATIGGYQARLVEFTAPPRPRWRTVATGHAHLA